IWLSKRGTEIKAIQENNILPAAETGLLWTKYLSNNSINTRNNGNSSVQTVSPLVQTTWNQSPHYNALCPGGSVTGCVATAMSQIMRFWKFPAHGTGSSSYTAGSYGTLSCNYGATTYNWSNMPLSIGSANNDVATINYQAGVSVDMNYSPTGSGAYVITGDNPICAQHSFVTYFGYNPTTIHGEYRANYDDPTWLSMIEGDLDIGRPVEYVGWDPNNGGHTWVCDGYDANNLLHMNWGWGGASNGYFDINNMAPSGDNFSQGHEALLGIVPLPAVAVDAGVPSINSPAGYYCSGNFFPSLTLQNFGSSTITSCDINYKIDNGATQTFSWSGSIVTGQSSIIGLPSFTASPGSHTITCTSANPNGTTDANTANDQMVNVFNVTLGSVLPVVEGFETGSLPSANWNISHSSTANDWMVTSSAAATGVKAAMIDNSTNLAGSNSILQTASSYDLSSYASPALSFKLAYRQKTSSTSEKLQVYVSTDCGVTWISKWARVGSGLATVSGTAGSFVPAPTDFTTYTVNINSVLTDNQVMFRWQFYADASAPGNNIYLDDINIVNSATGIQNAVAANVNLTVYPNPSNGVVNIDLSLPEKHLVSVHVTDLLGRTVESIGAKTFNAGDNTLVIGEKTKYESGVYLVNIVVDGRTITKKVLIN
ncbi:MAG TPA: C10 family peptidase, partial [Bacteroidia bacterium]|nr:C10 family peptidase [Bacteroidia bacterium]